MKQAVCAKPCALFGNGVGLLVLHHLQAMFQHAQEAIGLGSSRAAASLTWPRARKRFERGKRGGGAQARIAPAQDQLLGLDEEFDLADAAAPELDVVAGDGDLAEWPSMGMDLPLDRMDVLDRGEIEIAPPDKGFEAA